VTLSPVQHAGWNALASAVNTMRCRPAGARVIDRGLSSQRTSGHDPAAGHRRRSYPSASGCRVHLFDLTRTLVPDAT
jgi:hypothetical protein